MTGPGHQVGSQEKAAEFCHIAKLPASCKLKKRESRGRETWKTVFLPVAYLGQGCTGRQEAIGQNSEKDLQLPLLAVQPQAGH